MNIIPFPAHRRAADSLDLTRQPVRMAANWQQAIVAECRRQKSLSPSIFDFLKNSGLLSRCTFLASDDATGPLTFRYVGGPTIKVLGAEWAEQHLGLPDEADPHQALADGVGAQYREAIESGEPIFNHALLTMRGKTYPFTHALVGWKDFSGRRALLSCITS